MDYPDYEQIRQKNRRLAFLWMIGDRLYYIGLLGIPFLVLEALLSIVFTHAKGSQVGLPLLNWTGLLLLLVCVAIFLLSPYLKDFARRKSGIHR